MDSTSFYNEIKKKRPKYAESKYELVAEILASKGASKGDFTRFGPIYQIFMYSFMLGFHTDNRLELRDSKRDFLEIGKWQPSGIVEIILMMIFSKKNLIGYSWSELEELEDEELQNVVANIINIMEEYANGGLSLLQDKLENNPEEFNDPFVFVNILKKVTDKYSSIRL